MENYTTEEIGDRSQPIEVTVIITDKTIQENKSPTVIPFSREVTDSQEDCANIN